MESTAVTRPVAVPVRVTAAYRRAVQEEAKAGLQTRVRTGGRWADLAGGGGGSCPGT